jgi:hypothetical protein
MFFYRSDDPLFKLNDFLLFYRILSIFVLIGLIPESAHSQCNG